MKNSLKLLAGAVAAVTAFGAQAAQIYNKNDTTLDITGQVEAVYWSGHNHANGDQTISNRARFGLEGRTKLAGDIYGFGKFEQQWENEEDSSGTNETSRDQYVGVDFGQGGVITAGRFLNNEYKIESVTDYYEYNAAYGEQYGDRNSGK
ncbi:MAG: porin, partial [Succinatimonas hippei]|nr:porin [Succinatimonas hippei]